MAPVDRDAVLTRLAACPVVDVHEHLSNQAGIHAEIHAETAREGRGLRAILPRAYVGFFDFFPGLASPRFDPGPRLPGGNLGELRAFINAQARAKGPAQDESTKPTGSTRPAGSTGPMASPAPCRDHVTCLNAGVVALHGYPCHPASIAELRALDQALRARYAVPAWIPTSLREAGNVTDIILDVPHANWGLDFARENAFPESPAAPAVHALLRLNSLLYAFDPEAWTPRTFLPRMAAEEWRVGAPPPECYDDFVDLVHRTLDWAAPRFVGFKCASAYERTLDFGPRRAVDVPRARATWGESLPTVSPGAARAFGNAVMHEILAHAERLGKPLQVHVGTALSPGSHPRHLARLLDAYPSLSFHLLHAGYPWTRETLDLVRARENAFLLLAWVPQLSRATTTRVLREVVADPVLLARTLAFGGDSACVEGTIGSLAVLKQCLARVLADEIAARTLSLADIEPLGTQLLATTSARAYGLGTPGLAGLEWK